MYIILDNYHGFIWELAHDEGPLLRVMPSLQTCD